MVSKTSVTNTKKSVSDTVAKKVSKKPAKNAATAKSKVKTAVVAEKKVSKPAGLNPIDEVLEIKAKNEAKKAAKLAKKSAVSTLQITEEKGAKANVNHAKNVTVKKNMQKANAMKFAESKGEAVSQCACCCCVKSAFTSGIFAAWARAYKNIFNYKGRTSRYEFWSFALINALVLSLLSLMFISSGFALTVFLSLVEAVSFFVLLALVVRRIHDTGNSAWNGYFRQWTLSLIFMLFLAWCGDKFVPASDAISNSSMWIYMANFLYKLAIAVFLLTFYYYFIKIVIVALFYEEDNIDNKYGKVAYNDACYKAMGLRYAIIMFLIAVLLSSSQATYIPQ